MPAAPAGCLKRCWRAPVDEKAHLRAVTPSDLPMLLEWRNDIHVRRGMETQHLISSFEHQKWFAEASLDATRRLFVAHDQTDFIGFAQLRGVTKGGVAQWGFYAKPGSPPGSGKKLCKLVLYHGFSVLGVHKIWGQVLAGNLASVALHRKLGFRQEGVLRDQKLIDGRYHSILCFGLLSNESQTTDSLRSKT